MHKICLALESLTYVLSNLLLVRSELSNIGLSAKTLSEKPPAGSNERSKSAGSQTDVKADLQKLHLNTQSFKDLKTDVSSSKGKNGTLCCFKLSNPVYSVFGRLIQVV